MLSSIEIQQYVSAGRIVIEPQFDPAQLRPFGLRVHLGARALKMPPGQHFDLGAEGVVPVMNELDITTSPLVLQPGDFVLASTVERVKVDDRICCRLDGRSTLARLGVMIHCTASAIDGNHTSVDTVVLELANVGPSTVSLPYLVGIGMLMFEESNRPADLSFEQAQYVGQSTAIAPNLAFVPPRFTGLDGETETDALEPGGSV